MFVALTAQIHYPLVFQQYLLAIKLKYNVF